MNKLLKKLKTRDSKIFEEVFEQYKNLVFYQCMSILHSREDSEDTLQETFIEFFNKIDSYDDNVNIKLELITIAKHRALDLYRKNKKDQESLSDNMDIYGRVDDSKESLIMTLNNLLSGLEADVIVKKLVYDFTFQEISISLAITLGEAQSIYYRALPKLKKYYKEK